MARPCTVSSSGTTAAASRSIAPKGRIYCSISRLSNTCTRKTDLGFEAIAHRQAVFPPLAGLPVASYFLFRFRNHLRDRDRVPALIDRDKSQVGGTGVQPLASEQFLGHHLYANLHR